MYRCSPPSGGSEQHARRWVGLQEWAYPLSKCIAAGWERAYADPRSGREYYVGPERTQDYTFPAPHTLKGGRTSRSMLTYATSSCQISTPLCLCSRSRSGRDRLGIVVRQRGRPTTPSFLPFPRTPGGAARNHPPLQPMRQAAAGGHRLSASRNPRNSLCAVGGSRKRQAQRA